MRSGYLNIKETEQDERKLAELQQQIKQMESAQTKKRSVSTRSCMLIRIF